MIHTQQSKFWFASTQRAWGNALHFAFEVAQGKVNEEDVLWIGDTEADWEAGNALGCGVVLVSNGLRNEAWLKSLRGAKVKSSILSLKDNVFGVFDVG